MTQQKSSRKLSPHVAAVVAFLTTPVKETNADKNLRKARKQDELPPSLKNLRNAKGKLVFRKGHGPSGIAPVQMEGTLSTGEHVHYRARGGCCHMDIRKSATGKVLKTFTLKIEILPRDSELQADSGIVLDALPKVGQPYRTKHPNGFSHMPRGVTCYLIRRWVKEYLASK